MKWIKTSDRLPETPNSWPVQALVYITIEVPASHLHEFYQTAKFYEGEWTDDNGHLIEEVHENFDTKVVAWMPIPEYKED